MRIALLVALFAIAVPATAASVAECSGACTIVGALSGFTPRVLDMTSGSTVRWTSPDVAHNNGDGVRPVQSESCLYEYYDPATPSAPVRFDVAGLALTATDARGATTTCTTAVGAPGGGFVLQYVCTIHSGMRGTIVVT
jgi:plastocyanin